MLNQILVGVSTRNYESSLDKPAAKLKSRGTSKSAASRHLVSQTTQKLEEYLSRRLESFELAALMMDGLEVAGQTVVVTLGITIDGTKVPLGIWLGSTENSRVCTAMLQDLLERGLRVDESILCVVDGGKLRWRLASRKSCGASRIWWGCSIETRPLPAGVGAGQKRPPRLSYSARSGPGGSRFANWANGLNGLRASWVD